MSTTYNDIKYKCMKHKLHVSSIRNLLKTGKYELDMYLTGTSNNSATIKL